MELTSSVEPGQAAVVSPSNDAREQLEHYFSSLFDREDERADVHRLVDSIQQGHAALTVHPRGEVETNRALEIIAQAQPMEVCDHDLDKQGMERAATAHDKEPIVKQLVDATRKIQ